MYSRSADNIRDHRHVTALLNDAELFENGIINKPTFSFDERGHLRNDIYYSVFVQSDDAAVAKYWPVLEEFVGEGGNLLDPLVVKEDVQNSFKVGDSVSGYELTGAFEYKEVELKANESFTVHISIMADKDKDKTLDTVKKMDSVYFAKLRNETIQNWRDEINKLEISVADETFNAWVKWVTLQPTLRRIYGCSFLPHHDYGRGGRGWRDLWQDLLALILMQPTEVRPQLLNNFLGIRIDGSNATIIGDKPGEFLADRNNIPRVWMDHGSWPLITTKLYVDKTGDYEFYLEKQHYFSDKFTHYTKNVLENHNDESTILKTKSGEEYEGCVIEHLLVQNVVPFFNVGKHNNIRLEDADWNDGLDMAHQHGESVAFTSFYGGNLIELATILRKLQSKGITSIELFEEFSLLLKDVDYASISKKKNTLQTYFDAVAKQISGKKVSHNIDALAKKLDEMGELLLSQVRENEWLTSENGSWFNGYYDNDSNRLDNPDKEHMTLTGQVFSIMCGAATNNQIKNIIQSADKYLFDETVGGYKLNTDYREVKENMGRLFGFAYGHKENGAMFSHMAFMYSNALYRRGFAHAGFKVMDTVFHHSVDIETSKIYPGVPEYFDPKGRGLYHYLTGSASWYILNAVTEVFGIKGDFGDVLLEPKLLKSQFNEEGKASIKTIINYNLVEIEYQNKDFLDFGEYTISEVFVDGESVSFIRTDMGVEFEENPIQKITVTLSK